MARHGPPIIWTEPKAKKEIEKLIEWLHDFEKPKQIFFIRFTKDRGYYVKNLREWAKKWPETCGKLYEEAKAAQEAKLATLGLAKEYEAKTVYFALKNCSGWRDAKDVSISGKNGKTIGVVVLPERKIDRKRDGTGSKAALGANAKTK